MRKLLLVLILAVPLSATDYYVDAARPDDTGNGQTWESAKQTIAAGVALLFAGDTLYVKAGTYNATVAPDFARNGTAQNPIRLSGGVGGETIVNSIAIAGNHLKVSADYIIIEGVTFTGADVAGRTTIQNYAGADNLTIRRCKFVDTAVGMAITGLGVVIDSNEFYGTKFDADNNHPIRVLNPGTATIRNNRFGPSALYHQRGIGLNSTATSTIENNTFLGAGRAHLWLNAVQTANVLNNIFVAPALLSSTNGYVISSLGATGNGSTVNSTNNLMLTGGLATKAFVDPALTITVNSAGRIVAFPQYRTPPRPSYLFITMDDAGTLPNSLLVAQQYYNPRGLRVVNCIQVDEVEKGNVSHDSAVAFINAGNDIASHSHSHTSLNSLAGFTITGPTANSKVTIATDTSAPDSVNWTGTLTLLESAVVQETISLNVGGAGTVKDRIGTLTSYINGKNYGAGAWTAVAAAGVTQPRTVTKSVMLAPVTAQAVNAATTLNFNSTAFYKVEVSEATAKLQAWIRAGATGRAATYTVKYFVAGGNTVDATVQDKIAAAGLLGARAATAASPTTNSLAALKPFDVNMITDTYLRAGYKGSSNVSFASATKQITATGVSLKTNNDLAIGDVVTVLGTTSNNAVLTISNIVEGGGNTTITVSEALTDEAGTSALLTCEAKLKRNVAALVAQNEISGRFDEIMSHAFSMGLSEIEHRWLAEAAMQSSNAFRHSLNDALDTVWNGTGADGNAWTVGAGSKLAPDNTLRFDHVFVAMADYRLRGTSPAKDAGVNTSSATADAAGKARPVGPKFDIGAYEYTPKLALELP